MGTNESILQIVGEEAIFDMRLQFNGKSAYDS